MIRKFEPRTGNYLGNQSPIEKMDDSVMSAVSPNSRILDDSQPTHLGAPGMWSTSTQEDYDRFYVARPVVGEWVRGVLKKWGIDPDHPEKLSYGRRIKVLNKLVRLHKEMTEKKEIDLLRRMTTGRDPSVPGGRIEALDTLMGRRGGLPEALLHRRRESSSKDREALHQRLRAWSRGDLHLEKPQGSSLHHLIEYDAAQTEGNFARTIAETNDTQVFVVENDWARATAGTGLEDISGEWHLPFEHCCWEFRVSGVRILVFTHASEGEDPFLWCCYGADGHWVIDDYGYLITENGLVGRPHDKSISNVEFPRVARLVHDNVRVACILIDAQVAEKSRVPASPTLNQSRAKRGKAPMQSHFVVRLLRRSERPRAARSTGASVGGARAPQRGHWRRGNFFHYDDPDSGREQYVNSGGFWVSKTWRSWYFAGDPNNLITKEYRL